MGFVGWGDLVLVVVLPVAAWWLAGQRRDEQGIWFLAGAVCFAVAVALNVLNLDLGHPALLLIIRSLLYATTFFMAEYFRRLLARASGPSLGKLMVLGLLVALLSVAAGVSWGRAFGAFIHHFSLMIFQGYLLSLLRDLQGEIESRGLLSIAVSIVVVLVANVAQVGAVLLSGETIPLGDSSTASILIYFANFTCVALYSLGYLALRAEIAQRAEVAMAASRVAEQERRRLAESAAESSQALVAERNRMILMHSRFEARNSLGLFNAAVIHEISQPVQKLLLNIESMARAPGFAKSGVSPEFHELRADVASIAGIVHSLRALLTDTLPTVSTVRVQGIIDPIRSIIEAEATLRKVTLEIDVTEIDADDRIEVNPVLLNRVVLNFISNAFQSLGNRAVFPDGDSPRVTLSFKRESHHDANVMSITCRDNGLGVPEDFDLSLERVPVSDRDEGMGVGLLLSKQLAALWRGQLSLTPQRPGLQVSLILPLMPPVLERTVRG